MYHNRQFEFFGPGYLYFKSFNLYIKGTFVPVQVDPYFAYGIYFMLRYGAMNQVQLRKPSMGKQYSGKASAWLNTSSIDDESTFGKNKRPMPLSRQRCISSFRFAGSV